MTLKQFFDISFHYFRSNQEIWHAAETFGSKHPNGFRKCMTGLFLLRQSEQVVRSPTMTWKQNLPHELYWAPMRAFTSTLEMYKKQVSLWFAKLKKKKDNKSRSLAKQKKKKICFLGDDSAEELRFCTTGSINHLFWQFTLLQCILTYGCLW